MRSDLRQKLEALAGEMDATSHRTGMDTLMAPPPRRIREWADRLRDLLVSYEEREGNDWFDAQIVDGWITQEEVYLLRRGINAEITSARPNEAGAPPHIKARAVYLSPPGGGNHRSHPDREPDGWERHVRYRRQVPCQCGYMAWEYRETQGRTFCIRCGGQKIGPPVQPEEEEE